MGRGAVAREKLWASARRLLDIFVLAPARLLRLGRHCLPRRAPAELGPDRRRPAGRAFWALELSILLIELAGFAELYETLADWLKYRSRPLDSRERALAWAVFGQGLPYYRIRIDERAWLGPKQWRFCYVSFCHIQSWGPMPDDILLHELMHVWQYWVFGARYIPWALWAQKHGGGYDYGGLEALRAVEGRARRAFNLEQQADILADFFRLENGLPPRWGQARPADKPIYAAFLTRVIHQEFTNDYL
jgi:hypothetical protein